jgi:hypothetical protein
LRAFFREFLQLFFPEVAARPVGLPDLSSDDYRAVDNPLAPALSALMQPGSLGRMLQKALSLRQTLSSPVDEAPKSLPINIIETYMRFSETEEEEFRRLIRREELQEVTHMLTIYEECGIIKGKRDALIKLLRFKFNDVPEAVAGKVQAIDTEAELDALIGGFFYGDGDLAPAERSAHPRHGERGEL